MALPAKKMNFEEITRSIPYLSPEEKETLEIMLQDDLYHELKKRKQKYQEEREAGQTFSVAEVLKEIEKS